MDKVFNYGRYSYRYHAEYQNRKTFGLVVCPNLAVIVKVPFGTTDDLIEKFLIQKWLWLEKSLCEARKYRKEYFERRYISGESYYYLDKLYMLKVEKSSVETVKMTPGKITVRTTKSVNNYAHNKALLEKWFASARNRIFLQEFAKIIQEQRIAKPPELREREMPKRWGSYHKNGVVLLNPKLIQAPRSAIRYVIIHELCHIDNPKHDQQFYEKLTALMPEWKAVKENLEIRFG
jgi:predicted metal-dependent hydrolase